MKRITRDVLYRDEYCFVERTNDSEKATLFARARYHQPERVAPSGESAVIYYWYSIGRYSEASARYISFLSSNDITLLRLTKLYKVILL